MACEAGLIEFNSQAVLADRMADVIESSLALALCDRGEAVLAASGGSTPAGLYQSLSTRSLRWENVFVSLVDERWVAPDQPGSNETFVRQTLLQERASAAMLGGLWQDAKTPIAAARDLSKAGAMTERTPDIVILGLGNDGHTASWFPHARGLDHAVSHNADAFVSVVANPSEVTGDFLQRVTMSLAHIRQAKLICLLISGKEKRETYLKARQPGPIDDMPVRAILSARPDIWVCWAP